jgi:hypothetical protein
MTYRPLPQPDIARLCIAKPVRTISGGNAKATVDPDKMSIEDWMRHEQRRTASARR